MTVEKQHEPMPVFGYTKQDQTAIDVVNEGKRIEELVLQYLDRLAETREPRAVDPRCLAIGRTEIQTGFMWVFRSVFQPERIK
jgi:hypothetical protein